MVIHGNANVGRASRLAGRRWVLALALMLYVCAAYSGNESTSWYRNFIDTMGGMLYAVAWPSATYDSVSFEGISYVSGGANVKIKIKGTSAFGGGDLWTEMILEIRDGSITDFHWGAHNALLMPPGQSISIMGQVMQELNQAYSESQGATGGGLEGGATFHIANRCEKEVRLALRFRDMEDEWRSDAWWTIRPNSATYLSYKGGRYPRTTNSIFYFYAEPTDPADDGYWGGDETRQVDGRTLPMKKVKDGAGDRNMILVCD